MPGIWGLSRRSNDSLPAPRARGHVNVAVHHWIIGDQDAVARWLAESPPRSLGVVPGHPRLRGPFTAGGTVVRSIAPNMLAHHPELTRVHGATMLSAAPDLAWLLGPARAAGGHHHHDHARHVAAGLGALTLAYAEACGSRQGLVVLDVSALDATDAAWLTGLLGEADPDRLELVLAGRTPDVPAPLAAALERHAVRVDLPGAKTRKAPGPLAAARLLARTYVATECLSDDRAQQAAYAGLNPVERAALHDLRAARLELLGEPSLRLGAIPFHRERGSTPGAGVAALTHAITQCFRAGWYDAAVEFGDRLRALLGTDGGALTMPAGA